MNQLKKTSIPKNSKKKNRKKINKAEIGGRKGLDPTRYGDWEKMAVVLISNKRILHDRF